MAFTGVAVIQQLTDKLVRITGLSLAGAAAGTIGTAGSGAQVLLPASFKPEPTAYDGVAVTPAEAVQVSLVPASSVTTQVPVEITKVGSTEATFVATLTNTTVATASAALEIYVRYL